MSDAMSTLMSGGGISFKFEQVGDKVEGTVLSLERRQDQDMTTNQPKTWANGDPVWVYLIQLQTEHRDPSVPDDDGVRTVWARNKMIGAIRDAFRAAGLDGNSSPIGGKLALQHHATEKPTQRGFSPTKLFRAKFEKAPPKSDDWGETPGEQGADADIPF